MHDVDIPDAVAWLGGLPPHATLVRRLAVTRSTSINESTRAWVYRIGAVAILALIVVDVIQGGMQLGQPSAS